MCIFFFSLFIIPLLQKFIYISSDIFDQLAVFQNLFLMSSATAIALSKLIQSPKLNQKQKLGVITRRPSENQTFVRKKKHQIFTMDAIIPAKQNFRDKSKSEIGGLQHQKSLQLFKGTVYQKMKFLSPNHETQSKVMSSFQQVSYQKSPRFSRNSQIELKKSSRNGSLIKQTCKPQDTFRNSTSQISMQSCTNKEDVRQISPQTIQKMQYSTKQILDLREQNVNLKHQIEVFRVKCKYLQEKLAKQQSQSGRNAVFLNKCNFCTLLEVQISKNGRYTGILQIQIAEKDKQIQQLTKKLKSQKDYSQRINIKNIQLQRQLTIIQNKFAQQQKIKLQLDDIINSLNQKLGKSANQIHYLNIQHNILLKNKYECEKFKAESAKLMTEKQNLTRLVGQYKQKLEVIRKLRNKKKINKPRSRSVYHEDLFQLSSEHSADGK